MLRKRGYEVRQVDVPHIRPLHASAYVSIRQHTSAYVSIRQHTCMQRGKYRGAPYSGIKVPHIRPLPTQV